MTIMARDEHLVGDKRCLVTSVRDCLEREKFTDCVLITREGIPVHVHRMMLSVSPLLKSLLLSSSCCRGVCSHYTETTVMLPDVSYKMLSIVLEFFYSGMIRSTSTEMLIVKDLLVNMFKVPKSLVMLYKKDGHTDCVECGEHVPVVNLLEHLVSHHVENPCVDDMCEVESGDSRAVSCSQHPGDKPCDIDLEKTRINNGLFNYVGQQDPVACVLDHYRIHFDNMVLYVKNEYPEVAIPSHVKFDDQKLRQLVRNNITNIMEPDSISLGEQQTENGGMLDFTDALNSYDPTPQRARSRSHEEFSEEESHQKLKNKSDFIKKMKSMLSSSSSDSDSENIGCRDLTGDCENNLSTIQDVSNVNSIKETHHIDAFTSACVKATEDCKEFEYSIEESASDMKQPSPASSKRKSCEFKDESSNSSSSVQPDVKKARVTSQTERLCRVCKKSQPADQFEKHVSTHLYEWWPEVERTDEKQNCKVPKCAKQFKKWNYYIQHLAAHHGELNSKLAARGQELSDYEQDGDIPDEAEMLRIGGKREALGRYGLPEDYFEQDQSHEASLGKEEQEKLNSSQNPLLDSSQEDAMVVLENGDEDIDVDDLLNDSQASSEPEDAQNDGGSDVTLPLEEDQTHQDRLKEVEEV